MGLGYVSCNLQPEMEKDVREGDNNGTGAGEGAATLRETARENRFGRWLGDGLARCNLQSETYERWSKMHNKRPGSC